jgi:hypothetical protein
MISEVDRGAEADIDATFRRKLSGLRRLPRQARPYALRAARDERALALKALLEKRADARQARRSFLRLQRPAPRRKKKGDPPAPA